MNSLFFMTPTRGWDEPPSFVFFASGSLPRLTDEFMATGFRHLCQRHPACQGHRTSQYRCGCLLHTGARPARAVRHIKRALEAGVTVEEIFEVLKLCVSQGVQACNLGVPLVKEELACGSGQRKA